MKRLLIVAALAVSLFNATAQSYDVAAYLYPAYAANDVRLRPFWPMGLGEWETVLTMQQRHPGHAWDRHPLWGYINEADPAVMEMEIDQAVSHGVNVFIFDWYWLDGRPWMETTLTEGFLKARNRDKMKFYLMWANHNVGNDWDTRISGHQEGNVIYRGGVERAEFEKICKRAIMPVLEKPSVKKVLKVPVIRKMAVSTIRKKLMKAFGGQLKYFIVGGAAINPEVEKLLLDIKFPLVVGYGMTECGPLIGGCHVQDFVPRSGGHILPGNEIRIESKDPYNEVGEILVRGEHVMMGYYKNEEATRATFTDDGWMRTGDLGLIDKKSNIFIKGRNKTMILGSSGQNIYPEEIEGKLNDMEGVVESVVVEREGKLIALVFPDYEGELRFRQTLPELMKENLQKLNEKLPKYAQIFKIELKKDEFEKTPKRSIKRFLYK